jgi:hypothetical protein
VYLATQCLYVSVAEALLLHHPNLDRFARNLSYRAASVTLWSPKINTSAKKQYSKRIASSFPAPPQAPAASFKSLYRKRSGLSFAPNTILVGRSASDRDLVTYGPESQTAHSWQDIFDSNPMAIRHGG